MIIFMSLLKIRSVVGPCAGKRESVRPVHRPFLQVQARALARVVAQV